VAGNGRLVTPEMADPAANAQLSSPSFVQVDRTGNLYITDSKQQMHSQGISGRRHQYDRWKYCASSAGAVILNSPTGIAIDEDGALYIADAGADHICG